MAKCLEREIDIFNSPHFVCFDTAAKYQFVFLRLIDSSTCFFETTPSRTAKHPITVMASMQSLLSTARLPFFPPCLPSQASDEKASFSASSSVRVSYTHDDEDRKKRGNAHAGVDSAMPTDSKWNNRQGESNSVSVDASVRIHDNGQSNFWGQVYAVYSILTKSLCFL